MELSWWKQSALVGNRLMVSCLITLSLRVGSAELITGELPPYSSAIMEHGGELTHDIVQVLNTMGFGNIALSYQPWPRGLKNMSLGNAIAAFPFTWTSERGRYLYYSVPITFDIQSWYTTPDKLFLEHSSWQGRTACVPKGWFSDAIDTVISEQGLSIRTTNRLSQCIELLKKGRVDLVSINDASLDSLPLLSGSDISKLSLYRQNVTYYLVTPRTEKGHDFIDAFNKAWLASALKDKWM
ncbi:TPA: transporter substrate-binding domain-containing protein [Aeromonas bestiarum]|nr:transporter substrate-binding domain-containing protein [Aeromonas bestiarum]HEH9406985.1 transporter substrate-binding domain-containing protein [Aeromonas bestiarum]